MKYRFNYNLEEKTFEKVTNDELNATISIELIIVADEKDASSYRTKLDDGAESFQIGEWIINSSNIFIDTKESTGLRIDVRAENINSYEIGNFYFVNNFTNNEHVIVESLLSLLVSIGSAKDLNDFDKNFVFPPISRIKIITK